MPHACIARTQNRQAHLSISELTRLCSRRPKRAYELQTSFRSALRAFRVAEDEQIWLLLFFISVRHSLLGRCSGHLQVRKIMKSACRLFTILILIIMPLAARSHNLSCHHVVAYRKTATSTPWTTLRRTLRLSPSGPVG